MKIFGQNENVLVRMKIFRQNENFWAKILYRSLVRIKKQRHSYFLFRFFIHRTLLPGKIYPGKNNYKNFF